MTNAKDPGDSSPGKDYLSKKETGAGPQAPRAMDHLAVAILAANGAEMNEALESLGNLRRDFVDWNEIRVARIQEIRRSLGNISGAEASAKMIRDEYNAFFDKKGALTYSFLANGKPAESRRALNQLLPRLGKGAVALLLFEFCPGAQMPLTDDALRQARREGLVGKSGDRGQLSRVLADSVELAGAALVVQYLELEATGSPYGEPLKKENGNARKPRKAARTKAAPEA